MFAPSTIEFLHKLAWILSSISGGILVFVLFIFGAQSVIPQLSKESNIRQSLNKSITHQWPFVLTLAILFCCTIGISYPVFYRTISLGAYWLWILLALSFAGMITIKNPRLLMINGFIAPFIIGSLISSFYFGAEFSVNILNNVVWFSPLHGIDLLFDLRNITLAVAVLFLARIAGILYLMLITKDETITNKLKTILQKNFFTFIIFFISFISSILRMDGVAFEESERIFYLQTSHYMINLIKMPYVAITLVSGIILLAAGGTIGLIKHKTNGFWYFALGSILTFTSLCLLVGLNNTSFFPSTKNIQDSLTIHNCMSTKLVIMHTIYVLIATPIISAIALSWLIVRINKQSSSILPLQ